MSVRASLATTDLDEIRTDQARLLKTNALQSCLIVGGVSIFYTVWIGAAVDLLYATAFTAATNFMILVSFLHSRIAVREPIGPGNYRRYLRTHTIVCSITGLVWGGFAIGLIDFDSSFSLFLACFLATSITLGGVLPSSEYRPGFVALASFNLIPVAIYIILNGQGSQKILGFGILIYFAFGMYASARSELDTQEGITARNLKSLTEQLVEKNAIIEKANQEKNRFLAATSHDLSQPLHAQGLLIHALKKKVVNPPERELIKKIEQTWRAQQNILQGLVDITRIDNGVIVAKPRVFDLKKHLERLAGEISETADQAGINLALDFQEASVRSDPVLLMRIVRNLLSNGIKFTPRGGDVSLRLLVENSNACIIVLDTGPGIPEADRSIVFDEFVQLESKTQNHERGLGLGLSIVRRLADILNVDIQMDTAVDKGTTFTLQLETVWPEQSSAEPAQPPSEDLCSAPLILVVDDERSVRDAMQSLLEEWGCQVLLAAGQDEAVQQLSAASRPPAMMLVDRRLGDKRDGVSVIHALRDELNEDVPAILITGDISGFVAPSAEYEIQVMPKPVDPAALRDALKAVC